MGSSWLNTGQILFKVGLSLIIEDKDQGSILATWIPDK